MDIIGIDCVTAEAELLAAIVSFFQRVGLTSKDVGIKFSSRQVPSKKKMSFFNSMYLCPLSMS